ncbi:hypothetical protein VTK73DRAFT_9855 [Phialemonium thermophilum]|uniref:Uncharacterized protein n=1 Tax=Phialemonium thermophilum TaxID=223376 RepID=A0ABR3XJE5_9PEZI
MGIVLGGTALQGSCLQGFVFPPKKHPGSVGLRRQARSVDRVVRGGDTNLCPGKYNRNCRASKPQVDDSSFFFSLQTIDPHSLRKDPFTEPICHHSYNRKGSNAEVERERKKCLASKISKYFEMTWDRNDIPPQSPLFLARTQPRRSRRFPCKTLAPGDDLCGLHVAHQATRLKL